jgi:hypothetical protein
MNFLLWNNSLDLAITQNGVREVGNNNGIEVCKYLRSVNLRAGNPYCLAGQYWSFDSTAKKLNMKNPLLKTGSTITFITYYKKHSQKVKENFKRGDWIFWRSGNKWKGHVERIDTVKKGGWCRLIGFNTGSGNPREGDGVHLKNRNLSHPLGIMHIEGVLGVEYE